MSAKRARHKRPFGNQPYRKCFVLSMEGTETEPRYFKSLAQQLQSRIVELECLKTPKGSSPKEVLSRMEEGLRKKRNDGRFRKNDEAWLIVDRDEWQPKDLDELLAWTNKDPRFNLAVSNPKFEFWLLLHFESGSGGTSPTKCAEKLKKHIPNYSKTLPSKLFDLSSVQAACHRAKQRDVPPCVGWPETPGVTTIYRLVQNLLGD